MPEPDINLINTSWFGNQKHTLCMANNKCKCLYHILSGYYFSAADAIPTSQFRNVCTICTFSDCPQVYQFVDPLSTKTTKIECEQQQNLIMQDPNTCQFT
jgi:hypothetical protein